MVFENLFRPYRRQSGVSKKRDNWPAGVIWASSEEQQRVTKKPDAPAEGAKGPSSSIAKKGEKLKEELDKIMDEIDAVLEENAEEFVKNYVQRGGQ